MARYLLDTNIVSYLVDSTSPFHEAVHTNLAALSDADEVTLSILSLYELHHWFAYDPAQQGAVAEVIRDFRLLPLAESGAELFGALMRDLRSGTSRQDLQRTITAILWQHENGAKWRSIPAELGPWWRAAQTYIRWARLGV